MDQGTNPRNEITSKGVQPSDQKYQGDIQGPAPGIKFLYLGIGWWVAPIQFGLQSAVGGSSLETPSSICSAHWIKKLFTQGTGNSSSKRNPGQENCLRGLLLRSFMVWWQQQQRHLLHQGDAFEHCPLALLGDLTWVRSLGVQRELL